MECPKMLNKKSSAVISHLACPGTEQTNAHFSIFIQIGVQPIHAERQVLHDGWGGGVVIWQLNIKEKQTVFIGSLYRSFDHHRV